MAQPQTACNTNAAVELAAGERQCVHKSAMHVASWRADRFCMSAWAALGWKTPPVRRDPLAVIRACVYWQGYMDVMWMNYTAVTDHSPDMFFPSGCPVECC